MKLISEYLGRIIATLAAIALVIGIISGFAAPIGDFFLSITTKQQDIAESVLDSMNDFDLNTEGSGGPGDSNPDPDAPGEEDDTEGPDAGPKTAFAVYSADDNSLTFYKNADYGSVSTGSTYNDKVVTAIYTGFETDTYSYVSQRPWKDYYSSIISVSFVDEIAPACTAYWFSDFAACTSIDLRKLNTSNVVNMADMFDDCRVLTSLDLSNFDTSKVTDMSGMFYRMYALTSLDVSSFDTTNVTSMKRMFGSLFSVTSLNLSNFNTANVTNMMGMFASCKELLSLNVSSFDTGKVTDMSNMFAGYASDTLAKYALDISNFDTSNVTDMSNMFSNRRSGSMPDLSHFDTSKVTDMSHMFSYNLSSSLDVSSFDTSNVTDMSGMFSATALNSLDISNFDTSKVTSMASMFEDSYKLHTIYVSDLWDTSKVTSGSKMFYKCTSLAGSNSNLDKYAGVAYANYTTGYLTYKPVPAA